MNGLHSCKPGNTPVVGQIKTFAIEQRTGKSGKAYTKISNKKADEGGQPYKIMSVSPTGYTDANGNVSFNLDIEPASGGAPTPPYERSAPKDPRSNGVGKEGYWERKEAADIAKQPRIERQHAQEMAIRYCALAHATTDITTEKLRTLIDWFQRDVGRVPEAPISKAEREIIEQGTPDDEEIPF